MYLKQCWMNNSVDPDQTPHPVASDLDLHFAKAYLPQYLGLLGLGINFKVTM